MTFDRITVMGAGAWGSALANTIVRAGRTVTLAARNGEAAARISSNRESTRLPGIRIDDRVTITGSLDDAARADAILLAVPAQDLRSAAGRLAASVAPRTPLVACAKGIERATGKFMTDVIAECVPQT